MKIWAYNINLGYNMWFDKYSLLKFNEYDKVERDFLYFEKDVWNRVTEFLPKQGINTVVIDLAEGIKYDSCPELAVDGSLSKEEFKEMLDRLRALGLNPVPKLDFSSAHDIWLKDYSRMLTTTPYRNLVKNLIDEVAELFDKPEYFHIGMGDESNDYQKHYGFIVTRGRINFWEDVNIMLEACRKNGARPMMSGEYYLREPYLFTKNISEDVVITARYDGDILPSMNEYGRDPRSQQQKALEELQKSFKNDIIYNGSGINAFNLDRLALFGKEHPENFLGVMSSPEEPCVDRVDFVHMNDAYRLGLAKRTNFPEE
jgi:hypothetical protein